MEGVVDVKKFCFSNMELAFFFLGVGERGLNNIDSEGVMSNLPPSVENGSICRVSDEFPVKMRIGYLKKSMIV